MTQPWRYKQKQGAGLLHVEKGKQSPYNLVNSGGDWALKEVKELSERGCRRSTLQQDWQVPGHRSQRVSILWRARDCICSL